MNSDTKGLIIAYLGAIIGIAVLLWDVYGFFPIIGYVIKPFTEVVFSLFISVAIMGKVYRRLRA
jgi:hypothetical protein